MKAIRALAAACTLLIASFTAHILAGGETLSPHSALSVALLSLVIAAILNRKSDDPIRVTLAIFIAQNAGHIILGGHANSDSQMLLSHLSAGLMSYHLLRYFDRNLPNLGQAFISLFAPVVPCIFVTTAPPCLEGSFVYRTLSDQHLTNAYSLRGPPLI